MVPRHLLLASRASRARWLAGRGNRMRRRILPLLAGAALMAGLVATTGQGWAARGPNRFSTFPSGAFGSSGGVRPLAPSATGPNSNITHKSGAQSETAVAIDPTNGKHMIASSNDLTSTQQVYESFDRGVHWTLTNFGQGNPFCYDPWVTFNAAGDAFVGYECSDQRIAYRKVGQTAWTKTTLAAGSFPDRD